MRAWQVTKHGEPGDALALVDVPLPEPGPGELRVRVQAAALGLPDVFMCRSTYAFRPELPFTPGQEVVGIVTAVGEGALSPSGALLRSTEVPQKGRIVVLFKFDENISDMRVQVGTGGAVAIYTDRGIAISIIRRVIIRMYAWLNYLPAR